MLFQFIRLASFVCTYPESLELTLSNAIGQGVRAARHKIDKIKSCDNAHRAVFLVNIYALASRYVHQTSSAHLACVHMRGSKCQPFDILLTLCAREGEVDVPDCDFDLQKVAALRK